MLYLIPLNFSWSESTQSAALIEATPLNKGQLSASISSVIAGNATDAQGLSADTVQVAMAAAQKIVGSDPAAPVMANQPTQLVALVDVPTETTGNGTVTVGKPTTLAVLASSSTLPTASSASTGSTTDLGLRPLITLTDGDTSGATRRPMIAVDLQPVGALAAAVPASLPTVEAPPHLRYLWLFISSDVPTLADSTDGDDDLDPHRPAPKDLIVPDRLPQADMNLSKYGLQQWNCAG